MAQMDQADCLDALDPSQEPHNVPEVAHHIRIDTNNQYVSASEEKSDEISILIGDGVRMPDAIEDRPVPEFRAMRRSRLLVGLYLCGTVAAVVTVIALGKLSPSDGSGATELHQQIPRIADIFAESPVEPKRTINVADPIPCTPAPADNRDILGSLHPFSPAAGAPTSSARAGGRKHKKATSRKHKRDGWHW